MDRVELFTPRHVQSNKYTIIDGKLVITHTKTLEDCMGKINLAIHRYLTSANIENFRAELKEI